MIPRPETKHDRRTGDTAVKTPGRTINDPPDAQTRLLRTQSPLLISPLQRLGSLHLQGERQQVQLLEELAAEFALEPGRIDPRTAVLTALLPPKSEGPDVPDGRAAGLSRGAHDSPPEKLRMDQGGDIARCEPPRRYSEMRSTRNQSLRAS